MAPTLSLQFLSIVLLLLMNDHGTEARDIKVEQRDQKQVEWYKATPVSNDESYGGGYISISESTQPNYKSSYATTKHNHHHENLNHPCETSDAHKSDQPNYISGYKTNTHDSNTPYISSYRTTSDAHKSDQPNYIAGYRTNTHDSNTPYITSYGTTSDAHKSDQPNYIAGYRTNTHDSNTPYITGYGTTSDAQKSDQPNYIAGYRTNTHDSNTPYITSYGTTSDAHKSDQPNYIAGYRTNTHDSNTPYITSYGTTSDAHKSDQPNYIAGYRTNTYDSNTPYITGYGTTSDAHKSDQPNYIAGYRTNTHDPNTPYITGYRTTSDAHKSDQPNYIAGYRTNTHDSKAPYTASYTISAKKSPKESSHDDTTKPYITQYSGTGPKIDPKASSHDDTIKPYITQYGRTGPKSDPKDTKSYITQYGGTGPKNDPKESSNIDHTEAFKTGFFALDDLYVGNVMTLQFPIQEVSRFLPREEAKSIPFSTSQLSSILQLFSLPEDSPEANSMRDTLRQCEAEPITGETKICATSLESMLEFVNTIIGSEAKHNILTTSYPTASSVPLQKYTILEVSEDINAPKWVACHPLPYPYALYYCHFIATGTRVFKVSLSGENDNKIEALGICHLDTSDWDPNHVIFRQLGITAGKDPVCHFFPVKHLMWVPQPSQATM